MRRETLAEAQALMNEILISHSLPPRTLGSDDIGKDEVPRDEDSDYHYDSGDEDFDAEGNLVDRDGKILFKADFADMGGEASTESLREEGLAEKEKAGGADEV